MERKHQRRRRRFRIWWPGWGGLLSLGFPGLFVVIGLALVGGAVSDLFEAQHFRDHGVSATGIVVNSEQKECPSTDNDIPDPVWTPPAPPPPPPPMPPLRYLEVNPVDAVPVIAGNTIEALPPDVCGSSTVAVEFGGTAYEREFEFFWEEGTEMEVLVDPEDPGQFVRLEDTETAETVAAIFQLVFGLVFTAISGFLVLIHFTEDF